MRLHTLVAVAAILLGCATSSSAQTVSLQFKNGLVTLSAQNASVGQILAEWARVGGTRMVNHQRVGGAPVTLELNDMPERQALDVLLRAAAGYVVTERQGTGGASMLGGVVILPTTSAPQNQPAVTFSTPSAVPRLFEEPRDDQQEASSLNRTVTVTPFPPTPGAATNPTVVRFPQQPGQPMSAFGTTTDTSAQSPQSPQTPQPQRPYTNTPLIVPGTSRPGEVTPVPQPQQPQPQAQPR